MSCKILFVAIMTGILIAVFFPALDFVPHSDDMISKIDNYMQMVTSLILFLSGIFIWRLLVKKRSEAEIQHIKESAIASCINAIAFTDLSGVLTYVNKSFLNLWGYERSDEVLGRNISDFYPYEERKKAQDIMNILKRQRRWRGEIMGLKKDKTRFFSQVSANVVCNKKNKPICFMSSTIDITDKKKAEEKLLNAERKLFYEKKKFEQVLDMYQEMSSIIQLNQLVDFVIEKASEILEAEKCSLMLFDDKSEELIIKGAIGLENIIISKTRLKVGEPLSGLIALNSKPMLVRDIEEEFPSYFRNRDKYRTKSFIAMPILIHDKLIGVVNVADKKGDNLSTFNEIDLKVLSTIVRLAALAIENAEYYRRLEYLSSADLITGIHNHRFFINTLDQEIERIRRYPKPLTLLMMDVNDFKSYNDTYGHVEGDCLLKAISSVILDELRSIDIFCRYSGDQFVAILPETDIDNAEIVARKIINAVYDMKTKAKVSLSIGISRYLKGRDRRDLIIKADNALKKAKNRNDLNIAVVD